MHIPTPNLPYKIIHLFVIIIIRVIVHGGIELIFRSNFLSYWKTLF